MPPRHLRKSVVSPTVRRVRTVGLLSAAIAAAAAAANLLLSQPSTGAPAGPTHAAANLTLNRPSTGETADPTRDSAGVPRATVAKPTVRPHPEPVASSSAPEPTQRSTTAPAPLPAKPPSEKVLNFDFQLQSTYYYCAPAATHMALTAHGVNLSQDQVAGRLGTTTNGTDSAEDTTRVLNSVLSTAFYQTRSIPGSAATPAEMDRLQADVVHAVSNGYAVVANIIGSATDAAGIRHDFPGGHYVTIVGYRDEGRTVKIADSSGMYGPGAYWISTINTANWIATRGYSA
ncbi:MAG: hypothetical protein V7603_3337 [Micromonosporaceae bacterium]